jgi:CubicO group peptidase (beta-lactamase class C family)
MSVTKSLVGRVAAVLIDSGMLDPAALLAAYVPELAASGYAGATVRHVLDMRSGIIFSEDYLDPASEIRRLEQCIGWSPARRDRAARLDLRLPGHAAAGQPPWRPVRLPVVRNRRARLGVRADRRGVDA